MLRTSIYLILSFIVATPALADDPIFVTDIALSTVYHDGMPCADESNQTYRFVINPRVVDLGVSPAHVSYVIRAALGEMQDWPGRNYCRVASSVPGVATVRYGTEVIAEASFEVKATFVEDLSLRVVDPLPLNSDYSELVKTAMTQNGALFGKDGWPPNDFNYLNSANSLAEVLPIVNAEDYADLLFLLTKQLHTDYVTRFLAERKNSRNFDRDAFNEAYRDGDGDFYHERAMAEAALLGSPGAILESFKLSGLSHAIHDALYNRSDSGIRKMSRDEVDIVFRNNGYLISAAELHRVGRILAIVSDAAENGYTISDQELFRDMTLPPGRPAIERALNARLGTLLKDSDHLLTTSSGLPPGVVYDCDGTWCKSFGEFAGRVRLLVTGTPDCTQVTDGRSKCRFSYRWVFSFGESLQGLPFQQDPVVDFSRALLKGVTAAIADEVATGTFAAAGTTWMLDGDLAIESR